MAGWFPPDFNSGVFRPVSLANYAAESGWDVAVVAQEPERPHDQRGIELRGRLSPRVHVLHHDLKGELTPSFRCTPELDGGLLTAVSHWSRAEKALSADAATVVVATGPPFRTFFSGLAVAATHGLPLVLDYRDEWTNCPFDFVKTGEFDREWERRCVRAAARIVMTTQSQIDHLVDAFPEVDRTKCTMIRNGWEPREFDVERKINGHDRAPGLECTVAFVGSLGDHALPGSFLTTYGRLLARRGELRQSLRVRFAGSKVAAAHEQLRQFPFPEALDLVGPLGKLEAVRAAQDSPALLMLNEPDIHRYIPGKLYDYLAARRPILVYGEGGEIAQIVRELDAGIVIPINDEQALEAALAALPALSRSYSPGPERDEWLARHTRGELARRYLEMLEGLIHE
jgi:glycosyltransferase involved in cell wall biosynthesis